MASRSLSPYLSLALSMRATFKSDFLAAAAAAAAAATLTLTWHENFRRVRVVVAHTVWG